MTDTAAPPAARVAAADRILDRAWGKPTQPIGGDDNREPIKVEITDLHRAKALAAFIAKTRGEITPD